MQTLPSIASLAQAFNCDPRIEAEHPEHGVLKYDVEFETEDERIGLSVLPLAGEVNVSLFTKKPARHIRLALEDVSAVEVVNTEEDGERDEKIQVRFHTQEVQTLTLRLRPVVMLLWGNQRDSPERHPPWERD
ncbi:hypothetical protein [Aquabacterium humicola]|uniref:hypothetical protein n=1 Tax=Aquabacterium humicola TaxID=3237377 RepID=UPI0025428450|nr:hypothetical protein [Rubrivivax pictus]